MAIIILIPKQKPSTKPSALAIGLPGQNCRIPKYGKVYKKVACEIMRLYKLLSEWNILLYNGHIDNIITDIYR